MIQVAVLVPQGDVTPGTILGPVQLFGQVNDALQSHGEAPRFRVELVGVDGTPVVYGGFCTITPQASLATARDPDLIVIPATQGPAERVATVNQDFLPWICRHHARGSEVASLCLGAMLLAATGLLEGRRATTHWIATGAFRRAYPGLHLVSDAVVTDERGIYTSGGALSFWNLLLYLVEKYVGRPWAIQAAKFFEIEVDRHSQAGFLIFQGQKDHGDAGVLAIQEYLEHHFSEPVTVDDLSDRFAVGRRTLERRFRSATSESVGVYLQRVRIEAAKKGLESGSTVTEVLFQVGYHDPRAFRSTFRRFTGMSPAEYLARYRRFTSGGKNLPSAVGASKN